MTDVESVYLAEIKNKLHILHHEDDQALADLIRFAHAEIQTWCGSFDLSNDQGRGLVYEYVRFLYNGQGEYFYPSYLTNLSSFGFKLSIAEDSK